MRSSSVSISWMSGSVSIGALLYSLAWTAVVLTCGVILFSRIEKTFMDTV